MRLHGRKYGEVGMSCKGKIYESVQIRKVKEVKVKKSIYQSKNYVNKQSERRWIKM